MEVILMYIHRAMEAKLKNLASHFPVVMVCGARQAGKTTLLNQIREKNKEIQYVTLDYPLLRTLAREYPELFLQQYRTPLIIDEFQYAPELLPYIKIRTDQAKQNGLSHPMKSTGLRIGSFLLSAIILPAGLSGCSPDKKALPNQPKTITAESTDHSSAQISESDLAPTIAQTAKNDDAQISLHPTESDIPQPPAFAEAVPPETISRPDWSSYFGELNGAAVLFDPEENTVQVYNENLADTRRSPCSTFKIISSLAGLENGVIVPENSTRTWSGETFWNDDWNRDMDFSSAFRTSCVWYYQQIIDEIGADTIQKTLDTLSYGNCDISDWQGRQNTNNSNPALTGFWIESSLKISPREQVNVLETLFGDASPYSPDTRTALEEVMFFSEASKKNCAIYGKTGMGKANGVVVDAWYTGFADVGHRIYFCIYLGETANQNISSTQAREIAVSLTKDYFLY